MVNFLVCGDIGAASNLVRNILLLSNDVDWPYRRSRLEVILDQYPEYLLANKHDWIFIEAKFRFFKTFYNADLSYELDWEDYKATVVYKDKPAVFINHSFVYDMDNFNVFLSHMPSLIVMPTTDLGLEWQIRAYCEKKGVDIMHNFTFDDNVEEQKAEYISKYGHEAWYAENIANMKSIISERRDHIVATVDPDIILPMEWLIGDNNNKIIDKLSKYFNIKFNKDEVVTVLDTWRSRHWPLNETMDWKYA